jgi:hypothetical protein
MDSPFCLNISKIDEIVKCLDELFLNDNFITGYNIYSKLPKQENTILCFSNMYSGKEYTEDMICDLKNINYSKRIIENYIRDKKGFYEWKSDWSIREEGKIKSNLKIRKFGEREYINLEELANNINFLDQIFEKKDKFIAEDVTSEINIPVKDKQNLKKLVDLFINNSSKFIFDKTGIKIKMRESYWRGAWYVPVLLIGGNILQYESDFPDFIKATKFFKKENGNEISFIIHKKLEELKKENYNLYLKDLGFNSEDCLANKSFILQYIDT